MAMLLLSLMVDSPTPSNFAWEGTVDLSLFTVYGDMIEGVVPVAIICAISLLCTALWLVAVRTHLRSADSRGA